MGNKHCYIASNELKIGEFKNIIKDLDETTEIYFKDYDNNIFPVGSMAYLKNADFEGTNLISFGKGAKILTIKNVIENIYRHNDIDDFEIHYRYSWGETGNIITDIEIEGNRIYLISNFMTK